MLPKGNCGGERDSAPWKVTYSGERSNELEESPDAEKSVAVSWSTEKLIKNRRDHLNYGQSHQKLRCLGGGWVPRPQLQRLVPKNGLGGGAEQRLLGRSRNRSVKFDWAETAWETRKESCHRGREQYSRGGEVENHIRGNLGEELGLCQC